MKPWINATALAVAVTIIAWQQMAIWRLEHRVDQMAYQRFAIDTARETAAGGPLVIMPGAAPTR